MNLGSGLLFWATLYIVYCQLVSQVREKERERGEGVDSASNQDNQPGLSCSVLWYTAIPKKYKDLDAAIW